jgi:predicted DCC family thiol-disulfide oxidoreductase YuxK
MENATIYFDGECIMCNYSIKYLIQRDKKEIFKIGYTKSLEPKNQDSIFLVYKGLTYKYSSAVIKSLILLGGFYKIAYLLYVFPKLFRDLVYIFVARNRYRWFGKHNSCPSPPKEWIKRMKTN